MGCFCSNINIYISTSYTYGGDFDDFSGISMVISVYRRYNTAIVADRYLYLRLQCNILPGH